METIRQLLDPRVMTRSYSRRQFTRPFYFTDTFFVSPENIDGDEYTLIFDPEEQQPVAGNAPGNSAHVMVPGLLQERKAVMFYAFNEVRLPGIVLEALRDPDSMALQDKGRVEVARQMDKFALRHAIFKEIVLASIIGKGAVYFDAQFYPLPTSSGAKISVDMGVASSHKTNIGGIIGSTWDNASAPIAADLTAIKDQAQKDGVEEPTEIITHVVNKDYLRNNTEFKTWAQYHGETATEILRGNMIPDLWGFNWHFVGGYWKYPGSGVQYPYLPYDKAIICPKPGPWLKATNGSNLVPGSIGVYSDIESALSAAQKVYGKFSYGKLKDNPIELAQFHGEKFGLHFADPGAIWIADAFPSSYP